MPIRAVLPTADQAEGMEIYYAMTEVLPTNITDGISYATGYQLTWSDDHLPDGSTKETAGKHIQRYIEEKAKKIGIAMG